MPTEYLNILNILELNPDGLTLFDILFEYQERKFKPEQNTKTMNRKVYSMTQSNVIIFTQGKEKKYLITEKGKQTLTKEMK